MAKVPPKNIDFKYNLSEYLVYLKRYKWLFIGLLAVILAVEVERTAQQFLFKIIVDRGAEFTAGTLLANKFIQIMLIVGGIFLGLILVKMVGKWLQIHLIMYLEGNMIIDLKQRYFSHIIQLDHNFHTTHKTGSLISRLTRGVSAIERMTDILVFNVAPLLFQLVIVIGSIVYFTWVPAAVIIITATVFVLYSVFIQNWQKDPSLRANRTEDIEKGQMADYFTNIDSVKYFGKEKAIKNKYNKLTAATRRAWINFEGYYRWWDFGHSLIIGLGTFFLILFPIVGFVRGEITMGTVVFIYTVYLGLMGPLFGFVSGIRNYYKAMADFEYLFRYGKVSNEIKDKKSARDLEIKRGSIEFKDVGFAYTRRKVFPKFNLKIKPNEKIALVGHSGCGKTTLVKLLYRFYDVEEGAILIDGRDIRDFKQESVRSEMSNVPQECVLFDDTIYNNIAFSNPKASKEEVMKAMKFAQLDKIVKEFPKKEKTIVGERGVRLSGGEKQRVSIARAILANKKILVLDEATSSLDSETEAEIQGSLEKLMQGRTSIIIAHRLSTIMKADRIIVMRRGRIVQQGSHNQLIKQPGEYQKLWNLQKGGYIK
ncbi:MAG: ABC transporter ATP-binding protein [archaeon]